MSRCGASKLHYSKRQDVMIEKHELTRKKLYDLVWEKPITHLAKELDTAAYQLHKICSEFRIPKPLPGHWSKLAHGKEVDKRPLTANVDLDYKPIIIISYGLVEAKPKKKKKRKTIFIKSPIPITKTLHADRLHPLVRKTMEAGFETDKYQNPYGLHRPKEICLSIEVYPETIRRSLLLADTIIKAIERRGHRFKIDIVREISIWPSDEKCVVKKCYFVIKGEKVSFAISEKKNRIEREYTKEEQAKLDSGGYVYRRYKYLSSGILKVKIPEARYYENTYMENGKMTVEEQIPVIVKAILTVADSQKKSRIWAKEDEIRRAKEKKLAEHKILLYKQEKQRIDDLKAQIKKWKKAVAIRKYLNAFEDAVGIEEEHDDHAMKYWLDWAYGYADQIDPLSKLRECQIKS
jgi:hypothetical protein